MLYHRKELKRDTIFVASIFAVYSGAILIKHPIGCFIEHFTGVPCPTCGMSSAWYHALHLDFKSAFYFHPLFFMVPLIVLYYAYETYFRPKKSNYFNSIMIIILLLFIGVYIVRMIWFRQALVN